MIKLLTIIPFFFLCLKLSAQIEFEKGYFISNSGERKDCLIRNLDWKNNPTKFVYKISEASEAITKTVQEISEFGVDGEDKFVKSEVRINRSPALADKLEETREIKYEKEELLLKLLVEGTASLYYYEDRNLRHFFYSTGNENPVQLAHKRFRNPDLTIGENNEYRQQLWNTLKCDGITRENYNRVRYRKDGLVKLFEKYNQCADPNWVIPEKKKIGFVFDISAKAGFNSSSLYISTGKAEFSKKGSLKYGAELAIILPFNRNKWALLLEPNYRTYKNNTSEASFGNIPINASVDYTSIELAVGLRHSLFLNKNNQVFLSGYLLNDVPLNSSYQAGGFDLDIIPQGNFAVGFGYKFQNRISAEFRYHFNREIFRLLNTTSEFKNISVIFGYTLF